MNYNLFNQLTVIDHLSYCRCFDTIKCYRGMVVTLSLCLHSCECNFWIKFLWKNIFGFNLNFYWENNNGLFSPYILNWVFKGIYRVLLNCLFLIIIPKWLLKVISSSEAMSTLKVTLKQCYTLECHLNVTIFSLLRLALKD